MCLKGCPFNRHQEKHHLIKSTKFRHTFNTPLENDDEHALHAHNLLELYVGQRWRTTRSKHARRDAALVSDASEQKASHNCTDICLESVMSRRRPEI